MSLNQTYKTLFQPLDLFKLRQLESDVSASVHRRQQPALDAILDDLRSVQADPYAGMDYNDDEDETCDSNGKA